MQMTQGLTRRNFFCLEICRIKRGNWTVLLAFVIGYHVKGDPTPSIRAPDFPLRFTSHTDHSTRALLTVLLYHCCSD